MSLLGIAGFVAIIAFAFAGVRMKKDRPTIEQTLDEMEIVETLVCPECGAEQIGEPKFCHSCKHEF